MPTWSSSEPYGIVRIFSVLLNVMGQLKFNKMKFSKWVFLELRLLKLKMFLKLSRRLFLWDYTGIKNVFQGKDVI